MSDEVLRVEDLHTYFFTREGTIRAARGVNLALKRGQIVAIAGESGAGKTTVALSLLNLVPPPGRVVRGRVLLDGRDVLQLHGEELRRLRGRDISIIFQDPTTALNPVLSVGQQVEEILTTHTTASRREVRRRVQEILAQVGIPDPQQLVSYHPFQLSGGMAQRVMIAIATALRPRVLVADEPTSALDVTVQASVLEQLKGLRDQHGTAILLITHDLGIVAQMAEEVIILYAGRVLEHALTPDLYRTPRHPYTARLLETRPRLDTTPPQQPLPAIPGIPPDLAEVGELCPFLPRCHKALSRCRLDPMPPLEVVGRQRVACYNPVTYG